MENYENKMVVPATSAGRFEALFGKELGANLAKLAEMAFKGKLINKDDLPTMATGVISLITGEATAQEFIEQYAKPRIRTESEESKEKRYKKALAKLNAKFGRG